MVALDYSPVTLASSSAALGKFFGMVLVLYFGWKFGGRLFKGTDDDTKEVKK